MLNVTLIGDWLAGTFTDDDKRDLRTIAIELHELRKSIMEIAEKLVNMSDKELLNNLNANQIDLKEREVLRCQEKLQGQLDRAEREL